MVLRGGFRFSAELFVKKAVSNFNGFELRNFDSNIFKVDSKQVLKVYSFYGSELRLPLLKFFELLQLLRLLSLELPSPDSKVSEKILIQDAE